MNRILIIAKPDLTIRRAAGSLMLKEFFDAINGIIVSSNTVNVNKELAHKHYGHLKHKFFYDWLVRYIQCYQCIVFIAETEMPIESVRRLLGSTIVEEADPKSIRAKYGLYSGMNGIHVSESPEAAEQEIQNWTDNGPLVIGQRNFDLNSYIEKYHDSSNYTEIIHKMMSDYKSKLVQADKVKKEVNQLLLKEATDVNETTVEIFSELFWEGINLHV